MSVTLEPKRGPERRPARAERVRRALRRTLLTAIGLLYVVSIPWYRGSDATARLVAGLPDWVAVALGCYIGVAILNACAWLLTPVPDAPGPEGEPGP